jgi:hypothetical protein
MITRDHFMGFIAGLAAAGVGFYFYKKNQARVDAFLAGKGINLPGAGAGDPSQGTLEDLVAHKERLEDLIAEREAAAAQ